jgi:HK97 gp10 family phage protein
MAELIDVQGLQKLQRDMQTLSQDVARKVSRAATSAAAQVVRKAAQQNITALGLVDSGNLRAAVGIARTKRTSLTSEHRVGVRSGGGYRNGDIAGGKTSDVKAAKSGSGKLGVDAFYWSFLEFGTVKRSGTPFLAPALAQNTQPAIDAMKKRLEARIKKAMK